ncbi:hypothetical protein GCM10007103_13060 [Salinimicrobium marinum]|uniref:Bacteroides conjugative transposon TraN protein n=1 Tax=Salinimicrobium marinum TaxID=680283 RepID=A0A918SCQ0_9FLAO|nr:DUF4138 domain-containing protein [Salinimicrobium marinum]GHA32999.1 hypothetical protein GCM10007103_13060 [Salinimicrobium marinum]
MKKILFIVLIVSHNVFAQHNKVLDTIFANEKHNVSLFFPSQVRQGIVGATNYTFSFNEENPQYFGLLKALPGKDSSLLVLTSDGQIYSWYVKYKEHLPQLNYFVKPTASIGNEIPVLDEQNIAKEEVAIANDQKVLKDSTAKLNYFQKLSQYYLNTSTGHLKSSRKDRLKLSVKDLINYRRETYIVFELENRSEIDFEVNYLNVYLTQGNKKRNASYQKLLTNPLFKLNFPEIIRHHQKKIFVYVLPKFTVGENQRIEVEVREKRGSRYLDLKFRG